MGEVYDYAIVGAGCSGLSLAVELINKISDRTRIALVDSRKSFVMDRIWCFWNTMPHQFSQAVQHQWNRWSIRYNGRDVLHQSTRYPYQYLPADAFYNTAFNVIDRSPTVDLFLGTNATHIEENESRATVITDKGKISARVVFDGRNLTATLHKMDFLLQHYTGQRIRSQRPIFDPETVTLMDFDISQQHGISFVYVLPFSEYEALVEPTVFSHFPFESAVYVEMIRNYMTKRFDAEDYEVLFQEQGVIPMTTELIPPVKPTRVIPIGTAAGMVRGSTGYGFLNIQNWNRAVVEYVIDNKYNRLEKSRSRLSVYLDRIFLAFLEKHPSEAPGMFYNLFCRVPANRLVRFLADKATSMDIASVIIAMPKLPFIQQAVNYLTAKEAV
ncbi:MAG: lycopene cyclase family protein [Desulfobacterales bacterium]